MSSASVSLRKITQTSALIILHSTLNLIKKLLILFVQLQNVAKFPSFHGNCAIKMVEAVLNV